MNADSPRHKLISTPRRISINAASPQDWTHLATFTRLKAPGLLPYELGVSYGDRTRLSSVTNYHHHQMTNDTKTNSYVGLAGCFPASREYRRSRKLFQKHDAEHFNEGLLNTVANRGHGATFVLTNQPKHLKVLLGVEEWTRTTNRLFCREKLYH